MWEAFVAGALAGYGVAIPVGAIAVLIVGLTARTSWRVGVGAALGAATADGVYALAAVLGGAALAGLIEPIAVPLRWVAAAVLLGLAVQAAVGGVRHYRDPVRAPVRGPASPGLTTPWRAFGGLLALTLLNPMTIVYFGALVMGRQAAGAAVGTGAAFVVAAFLASASWQLLLAGGGSVLGRALTGPRARLATALISAAVIAVLAVRLLLA